MRKKSEMVAMHASGGFGIIVHSHQMDKATSKEAQSGWFHMAAPTQVD